MASLQVQQTLGHDCDFINRDGASVSGEGFFSFFPLFFLSLLLYPPWSQQPWKFCLKVNREESGWKQLCKELWIGFELLKQPRGAFEAQQCNNIGSEIHKKAIKSHKWLCYTQYYYCSGCLPCHPRALHCTWSLCFICRPQCSAPLRSPPHFCSSGLKSIWFGCSALDPTVYLFRLVLHTWHSALVHLLFPRCAAQPAASTHPLCLSTVSR